MISPSLIDLSLPGILDDCRRDWMNAEHSPDAQAAFARKWAGALIDRAETPDAMAAQIEEVQNEATEFEGARDSLRSWIEDAINALECADEDGDNLTKTEIREKMNEVIQLLQKAIS